MKLYKTLLKWFFKLVVVFAAIKGSFLLINMSSYLALVGGLLLFCTAMFYFIYQIYLTIKTKI